MFLHISNTFAKKAKIANRKMFDIPRDQVCVFIAPRKGHVIKYE